MMETIEKDDRDEPEGAEVPVEVPIEITEPEEDDEREPGEGGDVEPGDGEEPDGDQDPEDATATERDAPRRTDVTEPGMRPGGHPAQQVATTG